MSLLEKSKHEKDGLSHAGTGHTSGRNETAHDLNIASIEEEARRLFTPSTVAREDVGLLRIMRANEWIELAKPKPIPKKLFDEFWIEGEICCLYSDTNRGKSILGVQIGESISSGKAIPSFAMDAHAQPVVYFDFELSEKQFENRYSVEYTEHYGFSENLLRAVLNPDACPPDGLSRVQYLLDSIEKSLAATGATKLIIDNLTYLESDTEKAKYVQVLMQHLKNLKSKHDLSILVLGHTPKRYNLANPLTINDLQGSKMFGNFIDSAFVIGDSSIGNNFRYLKQTKHRDGEFKYHDGNVCICEIAKPANFTGFRFHSYGSEYEQLKMHILTEKDDLKEMAKELHEKGESFREIAKALKISHQTASRYVKS